MLEWMNKNYGRILDIFRRFDSDNSGTISYEEFAAGMKDLGELRFMGFDVLTFQVAFTSPGNI